MRHVDIHDGVVERGNLVPIGKGDYNHGRVLKLLATMDLAGYLSGEWIAWEP